MRSLRIAGALALAAMVLTGCHRDGRPGYDGDHHRDHHHRGDHDRGDRDRS
ncbi:hypothetical protein JMG10_10420 [Nostoc ellipsosporum NOK]|uniref:hypothetical protein n=1 Tax=Sphingomonas sp. IBVSS2 TaxID=1985172 RepID=UPI0015C5152C|nr:hypothetical protein [Sphingomonas sp. IBVSS2]MDF2381881.1 hypothetical protein [Nostoc ellipsosporum NOK]